MSRYIDAKHFDERVRLAVGLEGANMTDDFIDGIQSTLMLLRTEPTADVREVVHGEWIAIRNDGECDLWECNVCHERSCCNGNYCSNCGADMRGGTE